MRSAFLCFSEFLIHINYKFLYAWILFLNSPLIIFIFPLWYISNLQSWSYNWMRSPHSFHISLDYRTQSTLPFCISIRISCFKRDLFHRRKISGIECIIFSIGKILIWSKNDENHLRKDNLKIHAQRYLLLIFEGENFDYT